MSSRQSSVKTIVPGNRGMEEIFEAEAHQIVDEAIDNAVRRLTADLTKDDDHVVLPQIEENEEGTIDSDTGLLIPNVKWMSADSFTVAGGLEKVVEFVETWERDSSWLYCVDFLREEDHPYSKRYRYAVKWSIPTRRKPIPRATASVFFTLEVSKFKPKSFPIAVYYIFESHRLVHRPGKSKFREKWLKNIIESKIKMMESVFF